MSPLILDPATLEQLKQVDTTIALVDRSGSVIGHFVPVTERGPEPTISDEELTRREQRGRGRPLAQILADLESDHDLYGGMAS